MSFIFDLFITGYNTLELNQLTGKMRSQEACTKMHTSLMVKANSLVFIYKSSIKEPSCGGALNTFSSNFSVILVDDFCVPD